MKITLYSLLFLMLCILTACETVKPYQRQYVDDAEMQMTNDVGQGFVQYIFSIREGTIPAGSSKGSGGCGCN